MINGYMYILKCSDNSYYVGSTKDIEIRVKEHNEGRGAHYTSKRTPVELVYFEEFHRIDDAYYREQQVKGWSRKKKEALINGEFEVLKRSSECRNDSHWERE